jgi:hypothetical protein
MADIETKWRKDRARLLVRVKAGAVPNEDSQEKYKLSLAEINVVRAEGGFPPLDRAYRANAFAGMMAINAEVCSSICLKVVLKLSVPYYILTLKIWGYCLSTALVLRWYSHT